jgi:dTMP kinase
MFIAFEGPEGSGKSTQVRLLVDRLRQRGVQVTATREPGGTRLGDELRQVLLLRDDLELGPLSEALLLSASRAQLVESVIVPALARGDVVVSDRFAASTVAYQGYGRGLNLDALAGLNTFATHGLQPDLTVLLDVPIEVGLARKHAQASAETSAAENRFEAEGGVFHGRVRAGYHALAAAEGDRWLCLDAQQHPEQLAGLIWERVAELMHLA